MPKPIDGDLRDYLRALQTILAHAPAGAPVDHALASLKDVLDADHPLDLDQETSYLYARIGEIERAQQQESNAPRGGIPLPESADVPQVVRERYERQPDQCPKCGEDLPYPGRQCLACGWAEPREP